MPAEVDVRFLDPPRDNDDSLEGDQEHDDIDVHAPAEGTEGAKGAEDDAAGSGKPPRRGVIYISSLAPGMNPAVVRKLISTHAPIRRLYLEPEDASKRKRRMANGGHSSVRYVEGWVELNSRKDAKRVAHVLDGSRVGPRKSSRFYEDIWHVKYLSGFTWDHLTEKTEFERRQRAQRLQLELSRARKDDEAFLKRLDKARQVKGMEARRGVNESKRVKRSFEQLEPIVKNVR